MNLALTITCATPDELISVVAKLSANEQTSAKCSKAKKAEDPKPVVEPNNGVTNFDTPTPEPAAATFTAPQVKEAFLAFFKKNGAAKCETLLAEFEVKNISALAPERFAEFMVKLS